MRQLILAIAIALLAAVFALQNSEPISVKLFFWDLVDASMALVLLVTLIIGLIIGMLFMAPGLYRRNRTISDLKSQIHGIQKEIKVKQQEQKPG